MRKALPAGAVGLAPGHKGAVGHAVPFGVQLGAVLLALSLFARVRLPEQEPTTSEQRHAILLE